MAAIPPICDFGWKAPRFTLTATEGRSYSLEPLKGRNGMAETGHGPEHQAASMGCSITWKQAAV